MRPGRSDGFEPLMVPRDRWLAAAWVAAALVAGIAAILGDVLVHACRLGGCPL